MSAVVTEAPFPCDTVGESSWGESVLESLGLHTLDHWQRAFAGTPAWLVDGIIHSSLTLLYGEPKTGKSRLVCSLTRALVSGDDWFGHRLRRDVQRVLILTADPGGLREYTDRLSDLKPKQVVTGAPPSAKNPGAWADLAGSLYASQIGLVVVDNLASWAPGVDWTEFGQTGPAFECLMQLDASGVPVLVVHHKPRSSKNPAGSVAVEGRFRHLLRLTQTTLTAYGNQAPEINYVIASAGDHVTDVRRGSDKSSDVALKPAPVRVNDPHRRAYDTLRGAPQASLRTVTKAADYLREAGIVDSTSSGKTMLEALARLGALTKVGTGRKGAAMSIQLSASFPSTPGQAAA